MFTICTVRVIVPRPIAWVSTQSGAGVDNLAPHSYFNGIADDPPMLMFSIEDKTDTYWNLQGVKQFVVNLVTLEHAEAMEISAVHMPPEQDEFSWAGITKTPSDCVRPPRAAEALTAMECEVDQITDVGKRNHLVIGRVIRYHLSASIWRNGRIDLSSYQTVGRLSNQYCEPGRRFKMHRPHFEELERHGSGID
jgi:flavin reductase (DIM6/NTAB) family NADH-FMN oxidoreductase RutF